MPRLFWTAIAIIAAGLLFLLISGDDAAPFGLSGDDFARLVYLGALGIVVAAGVFGSGIGLKGAARSIAIWLAIVVALVGGYQYRYELQDIASRLTAGLVPGSPVSTADAEGRVSVALERLADGHFAVRAEVNNAATWMVLDTGATTTVLTVADAHAAGLDAEKLSYTVPIMTANGPAQAARATANEIRVGDIARRNLPVLVAQQGMLDRSLLGMNFISTLTGFDMRGDRLTLID
jgi:aspartyl protease family protein